MPFKWTIGNAHYEVHNPELESFDLANLLPYVLEVRKKVFSDCVEHVGDKVCPGTEREEINSSTTDTVNTHVGIDRDIANTTEH